MKPFLPLLGTNNYFTRFAAQCDAWKLETPHAFMWLSIATGMGHLIGYRAYIEYDNPRRTYPTISGLLLSPSGVCRRGGGTKIAMKITKAAGGRILQGDVTPEGLVIALARAEAKDSGLETGARLLLYIEEMADVFNMKQSQTHMVNKLTALLNNDDAYEDAKKSMQIGPDGKLKDPLRIERPCLSALFTSAPTWFLESMTKTTRNGGFMSRVLGCHLEDRDHTHMSLVRNEEDDSQAQVAKMGDELRQLTEGVKGAFKVDKEAADEYVKWYYNSENETKLMPEGDYRTVRVRRHENVLKIAMLMGVAHGEQVVRPRYLEQAIEITEWLEPTMGEFYGWADAMESVRGQLERAITRTLVKNPAGMLHSKLSQTVNSYAQKGDGVRTLRSVLQGMHEAGQVRYVSKTGMDAVSPFTNDTAWPPKGWAVVGGGDDAKA